MVGVQTLADSMAVFTLPQDPAIQLLGIYLKAVNSSVQLCS